MGKSVRRQLRDMERFGIRSAEERIRQILDERTERLAARKNTMAAEAEELPRALICGSGRERVGIPVEMAAEVLSPQKCVPVPDGPPPLIGLFGRGGRLVSVIDLALALGLESASTDDESQHFVLLRHAQLPIALRVDRAYAVTDILPLTGEDATGFRNEAVIGYGKAQVGAELGETVSLLDPERLVRSFLPSSPVPGV